MKYEERKEVTRIKRRLKPWVKPSIATIMAVTITAITAQTLLPTIAAQRGYFAIGGEIFLLVALFYVSYVATKALLEINEE